MESSIMLIVLIALICPMEECIVKEATEVKIICDLSAKSTFKFYLFHKISARPNTSCLPSHVKSKVVVGSSSFANYCDR